MSPRPDVGAHPLGELPRGRASVRLVQFGDQLELDPDQDQRLGRDLDREGRQHRQRGGHAHRTACRRRGAGRALDERVGDLVRRLAGKLHMERGLIAHPEPWRHRDDLIG